VTEPTPLRRWLGNDPASVLELPEYSLSLPDTVVPAGFFRHSAGRAECGDGSSDECCDDCYVPPNCKRPGEITFKPGLRLQPRYTYDDGNDENDFFIRRFRMKASGNVYDVATYGAELKVDSSEKFNTPTTGNPNPIVENAWVDFTAKKDLAYFRVGLYDIPFSRNQLTRFKSLISSYLDTSI